mmetsp:Transcript_24480/g.70834  ORF Transcript_24480/g.70834 Transcript_24480/m.70834 type:complete len:292 (+) Transcript_24480:1024-1899(+)
MMLEIMKRTATRIDIDHMMAPPALRIAWSNTRSSSKIGEDRTTRMTRIMRATRTSRATRKAPTTEVECVSVPAHMKTNSTRPATTKTMSKKFHTAPGDKHQKKDTPSARARKSNSPRNMNVNMTENTSNTNGASALVSARYWTSAVIRTELSKMRTPTALSKRGRRTNFWTLGQPDDSVRISTVVECRAKAIAENAVLLSVVLGERTPVAASSRAASGLNSPRGEHGGVQGGVATGGTWSKRPFTVFDFRCGTAEAACFDENGGGDCSEAACWRRRVPSSSAAAACRRASS